MKTTPTSISQFLPFDLYMEFVENNILNSQNVKRKDEIQNKIFAIFEKYFKNLRSEGFIKPIENSKNRKNNFITGWNNFAHYAENEYTVEILVYTIFDSLLTKSTKLFCNKFKRENTEPTKQDFLDEYEKFVKAATDGNFGMLEESMNDYFFQIEASNCIESDDYIHFDIQNWNVVLYKYDIEEKTLVRAKNLEDFKIEHRTIEFKTGNLLIADWFRIQQFIDSFEDDKDRKSVNSALGRIEETDYFLKQKIIHVFVSNTCPTIFKHDDKIVVGKKNNQDKLDNKEILDQNILDLGFVCTDLWWTTIVEYDTLVEILSKTMTPREARLLIDKYLNEDSNYVTQIKIKPGTHHLYFCAHSEHEFDKKFNNEEVRKGDVKPYFVFSKNEIPYQEGSEK